MDVGSNSYWGQRTDDGCNRSQHCPHLASLVEKQDTEPRHHETWKKENFLQKWVSESLCFQKLQQQKTLSQFVDIPAKAVVLKLHVLFGDLLQDFQPCDFLGTVFFPGALII